MDIFRLFFNICLLRDGPEDLPHSRVLLGVLIIVNFAISTLIGSVVNGLRVAGLSGIAVLLFSFAFTKLLLFRRPERFLQTFSAMLGTDVIISVALLPSFYSIQYLPLSEVAGLFFNVTLFALLVWVVIVYGYIFSKALSVLINYGIAISIGYALLNTLIIGLLSSGGNSPA